MDSIGTVSSIDIFHSGFVSSLVGPSEESDDANVSVS